MPMDNSRRLMDQEILQLLREYKASRKPELRDKIVMQYSNLVESVARRFGGASEPTEDLVQEGYIGLITAVEGYNADKGVKFSTYATHFVIGQIKHYLRDRGKIIKEPAWLQELNQKVSRVMETLSQELGRVPTNGEIAKLMGMTEESVSDLLTSREVFKVASLDGGSEQDEESPATYDMDRVKTGKPVEFQLPIEDKVVLETALQKLKDLEQSVIQEFYFRDRNQTEIARSLGISCNYVSHILRNSTKKLKKILVTEELKETQKETVLMRRRIEDRVAVVEEGSVVDNLTRLYNRKYFESRLEEELSRASRYQDEVAVLLVSLEGYEQAGRIYGTLRAEEILRSMSELLSTKVRKADIVTRYDSQTFALILPHTGETVRFVVDRLAKLLGVWMEEEGLFEGRAPMRLLLSSAYYPQGGATAVELTSAVFAELFPAAQETLLPKAA